MFAERVRPDRYGGDASPAQGAATVVAGITTSNVTLTVTGGVREADDSDTDDG